MNARSARRYRRGLLCSLSLLVAGAGAQTLDVTRHVVAGGGGQSSGGDFSMSGTVGQPDASASISGGAFELRGGYWVDAAPAGPERVFRDGFENP